MIYDAHDSSRGPTADLIYYSEAANSVISYQSDKEKELEKKFKEADQEVLKQIKQSLNASGQVLESVKTNIRERLDPLREIEELSSLLKISEEKGSILSHALEVVCNTLNAQISAIFIIDKDGLLKRVGIFGVDKKGQTIDSDWYREEAYEINSESFVGRAAVSEKGTGYGQFQFTASLKDENNIDEHGRRKYLEKCAPLGRAIAVPINGQRRTYGVLRIINTIDPTTKNIVEDAEFKEIDVVWLSLLATYIANTLSNFRRKLQTKILENLNYRIAHPVHSTKTYYQENLNYYQGILDLLVMNSETAFKAGIIRLVNDDTQTLNVVATSIFTHDEDRNNDPIEIGQGLAGSVAKSRRRLVLLDLIEKQFNNEPWVIRNSFKTFSCLPLISRGHLVGTLSLYTGYRYDYHKNSIDFLQSIAESIATYTLLEFYSSKDKLTKLFEEYKKKQNLYSKSLSLKNYNSDQKDQELKISNFDQTPKETIFQSKSHNKVLPLSKEPNFYRFALPSSATNEERQNFKKNIKKLQAKEQKWSVFYDETREGEEEAYICFKKEDAKSLNSYAAYIVTTVFSKIFQNF